MNIEHVIDSYPLSPMQQGMLFHHLSTEVAGVDIEQVIGTLKESIDSEAFECAWRLVIQRHAVLRTRFRWEGVQDSRQEVVQNVQVQMLREDWRGTSPAERQNQFEAWLLADRRRGLDPRVAPLMRLALFQMGEADYRIVWTFHHLLLDARAIGMVLDEVFTLMDTYVRGDDLALPEPQPYRRYIDWLQRSNDSNAERFWRQSLDGFKSPTPLVGARTVRSAVGVADIVAEQEFDVSESVTDRLRAIAKENKFTLNTIVQGAWALLLSRYTGEEEVLFGAVRACRRSSVEGAESIVGLFINTVPVRIRVPAESELLHWLDGLRVNWVAMREYEHTPLAEIQNWSAISRGQPLFASILSFQDPSWDAGLRAQGGPWNRRSFFIRSQPNYPLAVDVCGGSGLRLKFIYRRRQFDSGTIKRMLGHLKMLLESMASNPQQLLSDLNMLTEFERNQILVDWNKTEAEFPGEKCVHQLFEEQVRRTPHALAVADDEGELTYDELNERADRLAHYLRSRGVGSDVCVGVCLERSAAMVVALLAVLKSGGAYVPLDPSYPKHRLAFMFEDSNMPVLLTRESLCRELEAEAPGVTLLAVDSLLDATRDPKPETRSEVPPERSKSTDLAYVIYTSGSTGVPKGVEIEHRSLVNLVTWHQRTYKVSPEDRATLVATPAFDASVWELWPYLTAGASVHIPDEATRLSTARLVTWLAERKITLSFIPTPIAESLIDEKWPVNSGLRALLTGGDRLHRSPGPDFPCALVNHYGPTENTVVTTWVAVPPLPRKGDAPPIGRPVANAQVYVLDRFLKPAPVGVPGELHIGGVGLARGYHRRPELTSEKFVRHPFSNDPNARLYQTGDLVRWRPDGIIEFLGRMDNQVKVRGWRIELGEIETALGTHPEVRESVVVAHEKSPGQTILAAYIVARNGRNPTSDELRAHLKITLPEQMIPGSFTCLNAIPLTQNGKVDRASLPVPEIAVAAEFVAPRTETEEQMAIIWREVLGVERVGVHDDFFELGGHSLMATRIIARVRSAFHVNISIRDLFERPTISDLTEATMRRRKESVVADAGIPRHQVEVHRVRGAEEVGGTDRRRGRVPMILGN